MKTFEELCKWIDDEKIYLLFPGMYQWQGEGCYTAYKNYENPNGCVMQENKNPLRALLKLHDELSSERAIGKNSANAVPQTNFKEKEK